MCHGQASPPFGTSSKTRHSDAIAIELCETRFPRRCATPLKRQLNLDLWQVIREGKAGMVAANLALSAYQRRLAEQFGIEPGAEMKTAADLADEKNTPLWLVDREISVTPLKRAYRSVRWTDRLGIVSGFDSKPLRARQRVGRRNRETSRKADILQSAFSEFAEAIRAALSQLDRGARHIHGWHGCAKNPRAKNRLSACSWSSAPGILAGIERELGAQQTPPADLLTDLKNNTATCRRVGRSGWRW